MMQASSRLRGRLAPFVFSMVLPLAAAVVLLPDEFSFYRRWFELGPNEVALRLAVLSTIFAKTLVVLLGSMVLLALFARWLQPPTLRVTSLVASIFLLGGLTADLELQRRVGNHIGDYLPYLLDPATFRWAGEGFDITPALRSVAGKLAIAFVPAFVLAWLAERWVAQSPERRGRLAIGGLLALALLALIAQPLLVRFSGGSALLSSLGEQLPWAWRIDAGQVDAVMKRSQSKLREHYARTLSQWASDPRPAGSSLDEAPRTTPDILLVVVESLRYDALDRDTMPNVWAMSSPGLESDRMSQGGFRLESHYATSNASHYGLFALLYGRSPLRYFETLDSREPPTLPTQLRAWGYGTHYLTCTDIHWRGMDRFMGPPHFIVEPMHGDSLEDCDREVVSRAATLLEPGERAPRLVLAFLMSTHFGYHYPTGAELFRPASPPPNALELEASHDRVTLVNRYRNSAHYVDSLIGQLLDQIELERTLVVVTGDHGESLFDDGTIAHSSLLSDVQTRVPLAMSGPGISGHALRRGPTDHGDLLPTLFALLGIEPERLAFYPGRDLLGGGVSEFVPLVHAKARRSSRDRVALVSSDFRYSLRLDAERGELRFMGKLEIDGHPSREPVSPPEAVMAVRWFDRYLESLVTR